MENKIKFYLKGEYLNCYLYFNSLRSAKNFASRSRKNDIDHLKVFSNDMVLLSEKLPFEDKWQDVKY